jgi:FKBP-type peptidyl-prolyl cis-trans isomerase SlyD
VTLAVPDLLVEEIFWYGFYDPKLVIEVPLKQLPHGKSLQSGQELLSKAQDGRTRLFRVVEVLGKTALLDGNHPLAGQDLVFEIETTEARDATSEEIAQSSEGTPPRHLH